MKTKITTEDILLTKTDQPILEILKARGFPVYGELWLDAKKEGYEWRIFKDIISGEITVVCEDLKNGRLQKTRSVMQNIIGTILHFRADTKKEGLNRS